MSKHSNLRVPSKKTSQEELEKVFAKAFVSYVLASRGRRATIRARQLVKLAGIDLTHSNIVRAAQFLKKLALRKLVTPQVKKRFAHSVTLNYVIDENSDLWKIIKSDPDTACKMIISITQA